MVFFNSFHPALSFEGYLDKLHTLAHSGKIKKFNWKARLYMALIASQHRDALRMVKPPQAVINLLAIVAKMAGLKL